MIISNQERGTSKRSSVSKILFNFIKVYIQRIEEVLYIIRVPLKTSGYEDEFVIISNDKFNGQKM